MRVTFDNEQKSTDRPVDFSTSVCLTYITRQNRCLPVSQDRPLLPAHLRRQQ